jgi:hypothetical protein
MQILGWADIVPSVDSRRVQEALEQRDRRRRRRRRLSYSPGDGRRTGATYRRRGCGDHR